MFSWFTELLWGPEEEETTSSSDKVSARVVPTSAATTTTTTNELSLSNSSSTFDYSGARSIVVAAIVEELEDGDIDSIIEAYEEQTGSTDEIPIELLEDLILETVESEMPIKDIIKAQPHLEFDLAGMSQKELAEIYRQQVKDLFDLGKDVVGRQIDYADIETIIGHSPAPPFEIEDDDEFNASGKEFNLGEWGVFNCSLRATLLLLSYQESNLETAGVILRLLRYTFLIIADPKT